MIRWTLLLLTLLYAAPVFAQYTATTAAGAAAAQAKANDLQGFEPVAGAPDTEKINPSGLVVGAYAMFFVAMFGFIVYVARSQSEMAKEMAELAERLRKAEKK